MKTNFFLNPNIGEQFRLQPHRRKGFTFFVKALSALLIVLLATPASVLAYECNGSDCECTDASAGGPKATGSTQQDVPDECKDCSGEDQNQNDQDDDPVKLSRMATYVKGCDTRPMGQPGGLRTATLAFGRQYVSDMPVNIGAPYSGAVGANWTHNYNVTLAVEPSGDKARLQTWNGTQKSFTRNLDGTYYTDGTYKLFKNGAGDYVMQMRHGTQYTFDSGNSNRLASITDRNGNAVTMTYDDLNLLTNVTDSVGRSLTIRYGTNYQISEVVDPIGRTNSFRYDSLGRLTNVADALGTKASYGYQGSSPWVAQVTNARNQTHAYTYDAVGKVIGETNASSQVQTYTRDDVAGWVRVDNFRGDVGSVKFDGNRYLVAITNAAGTTTRNVDSKGRVVSKQSTLSPPRPIITSQFAPGGCTCGINGGKIQQVDTLGRTNQWDYETTFNFRTVHTNAAGYVNRWAYDLHGNMTGHTNALGHATAFLYDTLGNRTHILDPYGHTTLYHYDIYGNRTNHIDPLGRSTRFSHDLAGRLTNRIDALGRSTSYDYDVRDRLTRRVDALGHESLWGYDGEGNVTAHTNELGNVTRHMYNNAGLKSSVTLPGNTNAFETYGYDANRNRTAITNALGNRTLYGYNAMNWLTATTNSLNHTWLFEYDAEGNRTATVDPVGRTNRFAYDDGDQLISLTLPGSTTPFESYGYDLTGNRTSVTNALSQVTRYAYDAETHLTGITNALQTAWVFACDANGQRTNSVDPNNHATGYFYDDAQQLTAVTNALNQGVRFEYDGVGNRTNLIDAKNQALGFGYDPMNRLTNINYAVGDNEQFGYDAAGNLTSYLARDGSPIYFDYDDANRLTHKSLDWGSYGVDYTYDAAGRLASVATDEFSTNRVEFAYDPAGRLTNETQSLFLYPPRSVGYEYDASGRRSKLIYPDGTFVTYDYNTNGWLTAIKDGGTNAIVTYEYDAAGRRTKRTLENSTFTVLDYDAAGQVTNIHHRVISGGSTNTLSRYQYGYDDAGQRKWMKRADGTGDVYAYDPIDQLTNVLYDATDPDTSPSGWSDSVTYNFDAAGNRTNVVSSAYGTRTYEVNSLNQYTTDDTNSYLTFLYDSNGNLTWDDRQDNYLTYDSENRLCYAEGDSHAIGDYVNLWYYYDGLGRLVGREGNGPLTHYVYDSEWRMIAEYEEWSSEMVLKAKYVYGLEIDEPVRMTRNGTNYYYHAAALGTVTEITSTNGTLVEQYRYDVYGTPTFKDGSGNPLSTSAIGNRLLFQGRDRDPDSGLYNFRHRYYSPSIGRFVQVDPLGKPSHEALRKTLLAICGRIQQNPIREFGYHPRYPSQIDPNPDAYAELLEDSNPYCFLLNSPQDLMDPSGEGWQPGGFGGGRVRNDTSNNVWVLIGGQYKCLKPGQSSRWLIDDVDGYWWNGKFYALHGGLGAIGTKNVSCSKDPWNCKSDSADSPINRGAMHNHDASKDFPEVDK